uniref:G-patch domain-containing protein n=1 Tax=Heterorhabditis bacteriophora TaxID=37862 RepID=A0A1I7X9I8_HETBA
MAMDDDDGMESFEVDDRDLEFAMNPGRRHFQTKNQATYGIWADREESDEDGEDAYARPSFGKRRKKDYSAPVNFISGGIKQGTNLDSSENSESKKDDAPIEISFKRPAKKLVKQTGANVFAGMRSSTVKSTVDPNVFADWAKHGKGHVVMNMMKAMGYKEGEGLGVSSQGIVEPVQAVVRKGRGAVGAYGKEAVGPKFGESAADAQRRMGDKLETQVEDEPRQPLPKGSWKRSGKVIYFSIYNICIYIMNVHFQVKTRYKTIDEVIQEGGSIGHRAAAQTGVKVIDMTGPEQRVYTGYDSFSMRTRATYDDGSDRDVFDVPELMHNLNLLVDLTEENIRRNDYQLRTIKDQTTALEYDLARMREVLSNEEMEAQRMQDVLDLIEGFSQRKGAQAPSINDYQQLFLKLRAEYMEEYRLFNLESVAIPCVLPQIQAHFSKWKPLDPDHLIYGVDLMKEWKEILVDSDEKYMFTSNIKSFGMVLLCSAIFYIDVCAKHIYSDQLCAYDRLLWEGWLPSLRRASLDWDPRDQMERMLRIIEMWLPVLPVWMKENILEQVIIPRISDRVSTWDPLTDHIPIHSWLVPWLAVLGDRLQPVLAPIRQKLAKALRLWNPTDKSNCNVGILSAMAILKPWSGVWAPATMAGFLTQNVVPKLERCLDTMNLDPRVNTKYEEWFAVMQWLGMISPDTIASIVTKYFFPRWYSTLCTWLDSPSAILNEVKLWYREWDGRIPTQLREYPTIKENLRRGMVALMESSQGLRVSAAPPPPPLIQPAPPVTRYAFNLKNFNSSNCCIFNRLHFTTPNFFGCLRNVLGAPTITQLSLKEIIDRMAAQHDLTHLPQKDRYKDGRQVSFASSYSTLSYYTTALFLFFKYFVQTGYLFSLQVYWFGTQSIYLDRDVVFVLDTEQFSWRPIGMSELLQLAGINRPHVTPQISNEKLGPALLPKKKLIGENIGLYKINRYEVLYVKLYICNILRLILRDQATPCQKTSGSQIKEEEEEENEEEEKLDERNSRIPKPKKDSSGRCVFDGNMFGYLQDVFESKNKDTVIKSHDIRLAVDAFSACVARVGADIEAPKYVINEQKIFEATVRLCFQYLGDAFYNLVSRSKNEIKTEAEDNCYINLKWKHIKKYQAPLKQYLQSILTFLNEVQTAVVISSTLKAILRLLNLYAHFTKLSRNLVKFLDVLSHHQALVRVWTRKTLDCRVVSYMCMNQLIKTHPDNFSNLYKACYLGFVSNAREVTDETWPLLSFMQRTFAELTLLAPGIAYPYAFVYIRQTAIHLRNALISKKRKDLVQTIYNWQLIQCLYLWVRVVSKVHTVNGAEAIGELSYPLTQIILGVSKLVLLDDMARILRRKPKVGRGASKILDFDCCLKVGALQMEEASWRSSASDYIFKILIQSAHIVCNEAGFSDLILPVVFKLRRFIKSIRSADHSRLFKGLLEKLEEHSTFVRETLAHKEFNIKDEMQMLAVKFSLNHPDSPLRVYYRQWEKVWKMKQAALIKTDKITTKNTAPRGTEKREVSAKAEVCKTSGTTSINHPFHF